MSVVGARPNFMKVAPIITALGNRTGRQTGDAEARHVLVHTGQHYDRMMSDSFFADLNLPRPDVHLGAGSGSHAAQTADIMRKFEGVLMEEQPDALIVVGDVNSTLACALVAAKIRFDTTGRRPLIAHVEAGLRSFDHTMPEEINRILTDQLSDLLFVTEKSGASNLEHEGVPAEKVHFVGNTMIDTLLAHRRQAEASSILENLKLRPSGSHNGSGRSAAPYALLTLHRPSNVDDRQNFLEILRGISDFANVQTVVFPAHPRTQKRIAEFGLESRFEWPHLAKEDTAAAQQQHPGAIRVIDPLGYLDFLCLMSHAALVVTDSGGIQEETTCLGVPCVTVRENTERPVTVTEGTNILAGVKEEGIRLSVVRQFGRQFSHTRPEMWDGHSAERILDVILAEMAKISHRGEQSRAAAS